ncbi:hypothetical protein N431DRAFT_526497, partial [Stipitochalara longipes BDJ]
RYSIHGLHHSSPIQRFLIHPTINSTWLSTTAMIKPKELEELLGPEMPKKSIPRLAPNQTPNFATKCHYTIRIYACTHKSFLPTPLITHLAPCLYAVPLTTSLLHLNELCSKCRPHPLGTEKKLRKFETLMNAEQKGEVSDIEAQISATTENLGGSADSIERGLKALNLAPTPSASQPAAKPALRLITENIYKVPAIEPTIEQPTDSDITTPTDIQPKKDRWVDLCPSVANGEVAASAKVVNRSIFSRIFRPFGRGDRGSFTESIAEDQTVEEARAEYEIGVNGTKTGERSGAGWVKVKKDPDWEVMSDEEGKEKILWKDEGEWVDVDR